MRNVLENIHRLAEEVADGLGYELDDVELLGQGRRMLLRVTIDKESGVSLDDCEAFSRDFGALLDVEDPIEGNFTLEVSSPGLDRPLKRPRDFIKSVGKLARVVTVEKNDGGNFIVGRIKHADDSGIKLMVGEREFDLPYASIKKARLEVEL